jgi:uncharacterized protein YyaL (SSP411 family)
MANKLHKETSPYLLQHAENPVDWHPWGTEALALAKRQDKPIFLSIGYAACHWCHVMAYESFEDPQTAHLMNKHFINIKVDREERPDIDTIYMNAVVALTGQGGWPLSVFLTPDGKPFYGGTYFPPQRRYNIPSFQEVLLFLHDQWQSNRVRVLESSEELTRRLHQYSHPTQEVRDLDPEVLDQALQKLFEQYDWEHGGWGKAPKFPSSSVIETLLLHYHRKKARLTLDIATHALMHMRQGGIHDQIGGGFHRYSVDEQWSIPHFEKMLYDNALLLRVYLHHWQITADPDSFEVIDRMIAFLVREMRDPKGGYYSSLDADSEGEEGRYYVWKIDEIVEACNHRELSEIALKAFGVSEGGNFEGANVLTQPFPLSVLAQELRIEETELRHGLKQIRDKLLKQRERRPRPATDDKVLTAWNGLLLIALAEAARALARPEILDLAQDLALFSLEELVHDGRLHRSWRNGQARSSAYLEDYAALGLGLITLYQTDFDPIWLDAARSFGSEILDHFCDTDGGFFDTRDDHETLITRPKSVQDTPTPSGSALAVALLLQLSALEGDQRWFEPALKALSSMQDTAGIYPSAFAGWLNALDFALGPQLQLAVTGAPGEIGFESLLGILKQAYLPRLVRAAGDPKAPSQANLLRSRPASIQGAMAYLCQGFTCQLPTQSPETLKQQIADALEDT